MPLPRPPPARPWWVIGTVGFLAAVGVVVWSGVVTTVGSVTPDLNRLQGRSDTAVRVDFEVYRPAAWP